MKNESTKRHNYSTAVENHSFVIVQLNYQIQTSLDRCSINFTLRKWQR